jgi:adenine-specific DNA-methyltransferase
MRIYKNFKEQNQITLYNGNCLNLLKKIPSESVDIVITSPPYCMGKAYENPHDDIETFKKQHSLIFPDLYRILKIGGSICLAGRISYKRFIYTATRLLCI